MWNYLSYEQLEAHIAVLTIDRQEALNALNGEVLSELDEALDMISEKALTEDLRVLILTGAGRSFVAGADIAVQSVFDYDAGLNWGRNGARIFKKLEDLPLATIAAVNGFALGGGCELALSCDMIIAGEKAKFGQPEVGLGITPGFSGTQRLARKIGSFKAKELIFTGDHINAAEAERIGLANKVAEQEKLLEEALDMARRVAKNAPIAVRLAKKAVNLTEEISLTNGIAAENTLFAECYRTQDQKTGMQAFLHKEKAEFENK